MFQMTEIIVDKKQLDEKLAQAADGDLIELRIVPPDSDCGDYAPAFLHIAAIRDRGEYRDLEGVDEYLAGCRVTKMA